VRVISSWAPAVLYMAAIWIMSSLAVDTMPLARVPYADKVVHFVEYGILGFLLTHATFRTWPTRHPLRTAALAVLIAVLWAWLDEIHQALVPGRSSDALDLVADGLGAVTGAMARSIFALRAPAPQERRG
jgi:VanZ family protein